MDRFLDALEGAPADSCKFIAIDVETANQYAHSICQIGIAVVSAAGEIHTAGYDINPEQTFDPRNIQIHGIDTKRVAKAQTFAPVLQHLRPLLEKHPLIQHSSFDQTAIDAACRRHAIPILAAHWYDSVTIARNAWPELRGNGGHGLGHLKTFLNLDFKHHDAEEDARAAAEVVLRAQDHTAQGFHILAQKKRGKSGADRPQVPGDPNGALFGHVACFTGALTHPHPIATDRATAAGITVQKNLSKQVTMLVVGGQDLLIRAGLSKTTQQIQAEAWIAEGGSVRILHEQAFWDLLKAKTGA
ncbi:hypothetical protein GCM10007939_12550 [Amylibacter marinus]|uniref:Exonuclease domain-containing protein n=1 Tax=Amylibacter marinus TaxID=1475483 RepID=A0ABQ5VUP1_9RHOB|nr:hypothetical protein GCM10007939_12550 [Amylibacter marinus]